MKRFLKLFCIFYIAAIPSAFSKDHSKEKSHSKTKPALSASSAKQEVAVFAGGCFWCMQPPFDRIVGMGVISTRVGYTGGAKENPTYEEVSSGTTGHREAIEVVYDPKKIKYSDLLEIFWKNIDPFDNLGQFCDKGEQYKSAIYFSTEAQKNEFLESKQLKEKELSNPAIITEIFPSQKFYPAEEYHQSYYAKNPIRYKFYRASCKRDKRLKEVWGEQKQK